MKRLCVCVCVCVWVMCLCISNISSSLVARGTRFSAATTLRQHLRMPANSRRRQRRPAVYNAARYALLATWRLLLLLSGLCLCCAALRARLSVRASFMLSLPRSRATRFRHQCGQFHVRVGTQEGRGQNVRCHARNLRRRAVVIK